MFLYKVFHLKLYDHVNFYSRGRNLMTERLHSFNFLLEVALSSFNGLIPKRKDICVVHGQLHVLKSSSDTKCRMKGKEVTRFF